MRKFGRLFILALAIGGMLLASVLARPSSVAACTCVRLGPIGELAGQPGAVVIAGTIVGVQHGQFGERGQLVVQRVFQGPQDLPPRVPISGGDMCSFGLQDGSSVIFVASIDEAGLRPRSCGHYGDLNTAEGRALAQQAEAAFGPGPAPPTDDSGSIDLALIAIVLIVGVLVAALFGALVLVFGRRDGATAP